MNEEIFLGGIRLAFSDKIFYQQFPLLLVSSAYRSSKNLPNIILLFFNWQRLVIQPVPNFQSQKSHNDSFSFSEINTEYTWHFPSSYCLTLYIYSTKIHQVPTMCTFMYRKPSTVMALKFLWGREEKPECSRPPGSFQGGDRAIWEKNPSLHRAPTLLPLASQWPQAVRVLQRTSRSPRGRPGNLHCLDARE